MAVHRLGVDIGATRLRVVLASHGSDGGIENVAVREIPAGLSSSGFIHDPVAVGNLLRDAIDEIGTREKRCILGISDDVARYFVGLFPARGNRKRRRAAADYVARDAFPELYEEKGKDQIATVVLPHPTSEKEAVILAVRRDALESRIAAVQAAGLRVDAIEHEAFALQRAFPNSHVILDVGLEESRLYGYGDPLRPIVATSKMAGEVITEELAFEMLAERDVAERRKRDDGAAPRVRRAFDELGLFVADKQAELRSAGVNVQSILLVGNGARVEEIRGVVERETEFPASLATLDGVKTTYQSGALARMAPDIAVAYGLAMHEESASAFDYSRAAKTGPWNELLETLEDGQVRLSAAALAAAFVLFILTGFIQNVRVDRAQADERQSAATELVAKKKFDDLSAFVANVSTAIAIRDQLRAQRRTAGYFADYLSAIENAMPPHLALQTVQDTGAGWTIDGRTRDERYVATAIEGLAAVPGLSADLGPLTPIDPPAVAALLQSNGLNLQDIPPEVRGELLRRGASGVPQIVAALRAAHADVPPALEAMTLREGPRVGFEILVTRNAFKP